MTGPQARRKWGGRTVETDVARVVHALQRTGPITLRELACVPDLDDWPEQRVEDAVVAAWARNVIFVDPSDQLVAI